MIMHTYIYIDVCAFLAQHRNDLPDHSRLAFVLVDVEFHPAGPNWVFDRVRCPLYVPTVLSRHQILRALDVFLYAQLVADTCLVWHNHELIHQDRGLYARIYHGDYIRIALPPPPAEMQSIPTRCVARLLQMGVEIQDLVPFYWVSDVDNDLDSMPTPYAVIDDVQSSEEMSRGSGSDASCFLQKTTKSLNRGRIIDHHGCEDFAALRDQYVQCSEEVPGLIAPQFQAPLPDFETELVPLWRHHAVEGPGGMERVAKVVSWYNDHQGYPLCAQPRLVQLFEDPLEWRALLMRAWIDLVDHAFDVHFFVVNPRPPYDMADVTAHVLLVQRPLADFKSVHISVLDDAVQAGFPRQWALIMPNQLMFQTGLDIMGYGYLCSPTSFGAVCSLWHGDQEITQEAAFATTHGMALSLFVQRQSLQGLIGSNEGLSLLQTGTMRRKIQLEKMVHHDEPDMSKVIKVVAGVHYMQLPTFLEFSSAPDHGDVESELRHWGHDCSCVLFKDYDVAVCYPRAIPKGSRPAIHLYLQIASESHVDFIVDRKLLATSTLEHMRFLHGQGYWRACIQSVICEEGFPAKLLRFYNNDAIEATISNERSQLPWPDRLPQQESLCPAFDSSKVTGCSTDCRLDLGMTLEDIEDFFQSGHEVLYTSLEGIELPPHIAHALALCQPLDRVDRLLIYCDGSSLPEKRRCPPARVEEQGHGDTWAFLVLAEEYTDASAPKLNFVGWTAQPVLFDDGASHHIGSTSIGSETSEREALFWSSLWRLAQNHNLPTTFCTDCIAAERQGAGINGANDASLSFRLLRANFQALESTLGDEFLSMSHVRGHSGDVWNDLADHLAKQERAKSFYLPRQNLDMRKWKKSLPFFWWVLTQDRSLPPFSEGFFDISPPALPPASMPAPTESVENFRDVHFQLSFGTCNVASLYTGAHGNVGKVQLLREQMREFKFNFLGLQETRCPPICSLVDQVLRLGAGASKGHWGVELWLNLNQPIAYVEGNPLLLTQQDVIVVHQEPRILVTKIDHIVWKACLIVAHAPQSGQSLAERSSWWDHFTNTLHRFDDGCPLYVMIDANAAPGLADHKAVGLEGFAETKSTPFLRHFLADFDLCLPATFDCHQGSRDTWISPQGDSAHCIDFVCVPSAQVSSCSLSRTVEDFELLNGDFDHRLSALQLDWKENHLWSRSNANSDKGADRINFHRSSISRQSVAQNLAKLSAPAWSTDIDTHFRCYNSDLMQCLSQSCPRPSRGPKKQFFTSELWTLRCKRVAAKKQLNAVRQRQRAELLLFILREWKSSAAQHEPERVTTFFGYTTSLVCWKLKLYARLHVHAKALRVQLRQSRSRALADALKLLPDNASANDILQTVKTHIGPTNMKHIKRKALPMLHDEDGQPCETRAQLLGRWIQFFGDMEGGTRLGLQEQWTVWRENLISFRQTQLHLSVDDLPTLTDLEIAFRRVPKHKASGLDGVPSDLCGCCPRELARQNYGALLKLVLHGQECLSHKGGLLAPAHKGKGPFTDPKAYRSLLVSSHLGKTLHRTVRQTQTHLLEAFMTRSQLGGKRKVPVTLGLHEARAYLRAAALQHQSAALLMVDLVEAFYRVLRPLAIGSSFTDEEIALLAQRLQLHPDVMQQLRRHLNDESAVAVAGMTPQAQRLLCAIHSDTYFKLPGQSDVCRTTIGSRPGDSFADAVFTFLFSRVLHCFREKLQQHDLVEFIGVDKVFDPFETQIRASHPQEIYSGPVWMDDLCVALQAPSAEGVIHKAGVASSLLLDTLIEHAMSPNLSKGKTELLVSLRGRGVRRLKKEHFGPNSPGTLPVIGETQTFHITIVGEYTHLGGLLHHRSDHRKEMRRRVALAHQAFNANRRHIFQNPDVELSKRVQLFQSLVLCRLLYGSESWFLPDWRSKNFLHAAIIKLYRRLLRLPPDAAWPDEEICVALELPTPTELLRRTRLRYLCTLHQCEHTVSWRLLHQDSDWCNLIRDDLKWLWAQLWYSSSA